MEKTYIVKLKNGTEFEFWFSDYSDDKKFEQMLKDYNVEYKIKDDGDK